MVSESATALSSSRVGLVPGPCLVCSTGRGRLVRLLHGTLCSSIEVSGNSASSLVSYLDQVTIDLDQPTPPYRQLASILRDKITRGELAGRLPSEKTLMQEYGLALGTVRKAIAVLRDEGLVQTTPGWGTYVTGTQAG